MNILCYAYYMDYILFINNMLYILLLYLNLGFFFRLVSLFYILECTFLKCSYITCYCQVIKIEKMSPKWQWLKDKEKSLQKRNRRKSADWSESFR